ncbi:MAG: preprotein translocase subunit YajC [Anaerovoracaceae bacterium]
MSGNMLATILPLVLLLVVMYFLLIRPQKKREKAVNAMRSSISVGDEIITIGGICGKIVKTKDESLVIQVGADKVKFEIMRWAVSKVVENGAKPAAKLSKETEEEVEEKKKPLPKRMKKPAPISDAATDEVPAEPTEEKAADTEEK